MKTYKKPKSNKQICGNCIEEFTRKEMVEVRVNGFITHRTIFCKTCAKNNSNENIKILVESN